MRVVGVRLVWVVRVVMVRLVWVVRVVMVRLVWVVRVVMMRSVWVMMMPHVSVGNMNVEELPPKGVDRVVQRRPAVRKWLIMGGIFEAVARRVHHCDRLLDVGRSHISTLCFRRCWRRAGDWRAVTQLVTTAAGLPARVQAEEGEQREQRECQAAAVEHRRLGYCHDTRCEKRTGCLRAGVCPRSTVGSFSSALVCCCRALISFGAPTGA